jgi:hypothetical protein
MKKYLLIVASQIFFFLTILLILPTILLRQRHFDLHQDASRQLTLSSPTDISLGFLSPLSNLNSVSLLLKNPNLLSTAPFTITVESRNLPSYTGSFSGRNIGDPSWITYKFSPYTNSPGTPFSIKLSTQSVDPHQLFLLADNRLQPVYRLTFKSADLSESFFLAKSTLLTKLSLINRPLLILYILLIFILNILYLLTLLPHRQQRYNKIKQPRP